MKPVGLLLALLLACCVRTDPTTPASPNILLVTLDTVRADRIGAYGYAPAGTPTLDRLAREGVLFESAVSATPITLPSHASILSGVEPPIHGVRDNAVFALAPEATLLSEILQRHGWRTGAFVGSHVLDPRYGLDQGFEVYSAPDLSAAGGLPAGERTADAVIGDAVAWLATIEPSERFFAWIHLYDPHRPWRPPEPWARRFKDPYDAEIAFCDAQLARLLRHLERGGLAGKLLVVVTADHGESLDEHGEPSHGAFIYQATLHVPLVISGPAVAAARGTRVTRPVPNMDLAATLLERAGLPREEMPALRGPSLLARDGTPVPGSPDRPLYVESYLPYYTYGWRALRGLLWRNHKLIEGVEPELYDQVADPGETTNLAASRPAKLAELRRQLAAVEGAFTSAPTAVDRSPEPGELELLAALGYFPRRAEGSPLDAALPDPHARIGDIVLYGKAVELYGEAHRLLATPAHSVWQTKQNEEEARTLLSSARGLLQQILGGNSEDLLALQLLGIVEARLGNHEAGVRALERVIREAPGNSSAHFNLGVAYLEIGRGDDGLREIEKAIALEPRQPAYYLRLARYYAESGDHERASRWLAEASGLVTPGSPQSREIEHLTEWMDQQRRPGAAVQVPD